MIQGSARGKTDKVGERNGVLEREIGWEEDRENR